MTDVTCSVCKKLRKEGDIGVVLAQYPHKSLCGECFLIYQKHLEDFNNNYFKTSSNKPEDELKEVLEFLYNEYLYEEHDVIKAMVALGFKEGDIVDEIHEKKKKFRDDI